MATRKKSHCVDPAAADPPVGFLAASLECIIEEEETRQNQRGRAAPSVASAWWIVSGDSQLAGTINEEMESHVITMEDRGFGRKPTNEEKIAAPDCVPWTEFDVSGLKQKRPDYKACPCYFPFICFSYAGTTCCILELQWCAACGEPGERCCDCCCRCRCGRMPCCFCCGPQCDSIECCNGCCKDGGCCEKKVTIDEPCCACCSCSRTCCRYAGCSLCCCHITCAGCLRGCENACCCEEERMMMDGDLRPIRASLAALSEMPKGGPKV
ncbi:hypothetical protein M885DRAFT_520230 [Pelagophyceae sp. CCMP2097]|nr:hypothetical protein M885DRAFT_520230 [Pelagophyceae sp. CCMP2097]